jgi:hypothetical protein
VALAIGSAETALANVKSALSRVITEAEGYPDLIRAYHSSETGQSNPMVQVRAGWCRAMQLSCGYIALPLQVQGSQW